MGALAPGRRDVRPGMWPASRHRIELPILVGAVMFGIVLMANAARFGVPAAVLGGGLAVAGGWGCRARFRRPAEAEEPTEN